jgi:hypothetical protein
MNFVLTVKWPVYGDKKEISVASVFMVTGC